jgi:4-hydroxythreonine-4-phosphate dehydrogenase
MNPKIAFTCGDPAGIGPEVIATWLKNHAEVASNIAVLGPAAWLEQINLYGAVGIPVGESMFQAQPGRPTLAGAQLAWQALERSAAGTKAGEFSAVVTGPVSKEWLQKAGYPFPGQTEFFADRWGGDATMAFCGGRLQVALLTWHIPFREVPAHLTAAELKRTIVAAAELARAVVPGVRTQEPRIGVCGLNPHAGEAGLLGLEEIAVIDPILNELRRDFPQLSRTQPADTIFARQLRGEFDVIVALYHDQGLAPLKTVDFDESVNVTLGLPFVRTSPDHGTAFSIAGKGQASGTSFANAVSVAQRLLELRSPRNDCR